MQNKFSIDYLIYVLVIILTVIIWILVLNSPSEFTDMKNAYQGF